VKPLWKTTVGVKVGVLDTLDFDNNEIHRVTSSFELTTFINWLLVEFILIRVFESFWMGFEVDFFL
jgi:hypothetical protein